MVKHMRNLKILKPKQVLNYMPHISKGNYNIPLNSLSHFNSSSKLRHNINLPPLKSFLLQFDE